MSDSRALTQEGQRALYAGDAVAARERFTEALRLHPRFAAALAGLADCHALAGAHQAALPLYEEALTHDPDDPWIRNNFALSLTAVGRIREAWVQAEARFQLQDKTRNFWSRPPRPRWDGGELPGRLVVLWEQGFGDMLQHLRFLPLAARRTGGIAFVCPAPLTQLVTVSFPFVELLPAGRPVRWAAFDACIALLSLPLVLGVGWENLPSEPYLSISGRPVNKSLPRSVGVVWRSSAFDPARNCPLAALLPLKDSGFRLASLQLDPSVEEAALLRTHGIESLAGADFHATAQGVAQVDVVLSVDTAPVHLAGAMGCATLLLLNEPAAVRWMQERADTPWYPSMRLLRKRAAESWDVLVARAMTELRGLGLAT
ncbi:MAG TPA: tetratricopeptide repeat protein [Burkholderiales bacterium]|nr:tetratricopeptide repeat protein [Burkholderiales bacterium]